MPLGAADSSEQMEPLVNSPNKGSILFHSSEESMKSADEPLKAPARTCCFCIDVRPATALLMILETAFFAALLFIGLVNLSNASSDDVTIPFLGLLICYFISLVGAVLVLYGVFAARPLLLVPYLVKQTFTITLTLLFVYKAVTVYFGHYGVSVSAVFRQLYEAEPAGTSFEEIQGSARPLQLSLNSVSASRHIGGLLLLGGCVALCIELLATDTVRKCYLTLRQRSRLPTSDRKA